MVPSALIRLLTAQSCMSRYFLTPKGSHGKASEVVDDDFKSIMICGLCFGGIFQLSARPGIQGVMRIPYVR